MARIRIDIDEDSGFCTGVVHAVKAADRVLDEKGRLHSLGELVHNPIEVGRLKAKGLEAIDCERFDALRDETVLIRAHGEPPATYEKAAANSIRLIDATCPIVIKLQQKIAAIHQELGPGGSILIFGKAGHPEVRSLVGHTGGRARVTSDAAGISSLSLEPPIHLFSQTTMAAKHYRQFHEALRNHLRSGGLDPSRALTVHDTICRQVARRESKIRDFAARYDLVVFVSGRESSNGRALYQVCRNVNPRSVFISGPDEIGSVSTEGVASIGICGATSTPRWLLAEIRERLKAALNITRS